MYDVVLIGGGLGGLECGVLLSKAGKSVAVIEQGARVGGCIQSYKRGGLTFDTGFHYVGGIGEGQSLYAPFRLLGLTELPWQRMDDYFDIVNIGGREYPFAQGYDNFRDTLTACFPKEKEALSRYVEMLRDTSAHQLDILKQPFAAINHTTLLSEASPFETNAYDYLTATFSDTALINVLSGTSLKMELRKKSLPLFTFTHVNSGYIESSWRLRGDGQMIADKLADAIRGNGGTVMCGKRVVELAEKDGKIATAVCSDGTHCDGKAFISDVNPSLTCAMIRHSERIRKIYRRRMSALANTTGMFTASLVLKPDATRYFNHNEYVYTGDANVWDIHEQNMPVRCVMISCKVPADGTDNTSATQTVTTNRSSTTTTQPSVQIDLLTPMSYNSCLQWQNTTEAHRDDGYKTMKERVAGECIALAEQAIPGLGNMVEHCYTSTPLTYRDYTGTPEGSAYGVRKDCNDPLSTMITPRTPIENLYLTGQSLILHGLHGVTMTALMTCSHILGSDYIIEKLHNI